MIEPIVIKVVDKVPIVVSGPQYVVCDNSDYPVVWQLDEEWAQFESRTMQANYKDGTYERVLFTGNTCALPALPVPGPVHVGLFAGDIHTTRPARLLAVRSATTDSGEERDSMPNGYAQAIKALDGKLDRNQGTENAGKALVVGDDGGVVPGEVQGSSLPAMSSDTAGKMLTNDGENAEWTEQDDWSRLVVTIKVDEKTGDNTWSCTADKTVGEIRSAVEGGRSVVAVSGFFDGASIPLVNTIGYILFQGVSPNMYPSGITNIVMVSGNSATMKSIPFNDHDAIHTFAETLNAAKQAQARENIGLTPVAKTDEMTQSVGLDTETGGLYTKPGPGAWYVTVTQTSSDSVVATADKTPQEIVAAYQAGYSIYANIVVKPDANSTEFAMAPIVFGDLDSFTVVFSTVRSMRFFTDVAVAFCAMFVDGGWSVNLFELAKTADIPDAYTLPVASPTQLGGVKPVAKTDAMTRGVGVDSNGGLYTEPDSVYYIDLEGTFPNFTTSKTNAEIHSAYQSGRTLVCRFYQDDTRWTLPLLSPTLGLWLFGAVISTGKPVDVDAAQGIAAIVGNGQGIVTQIDLAAKADIPAIPTALPNPNALTIKVGDNTTTYDGSAAKTVEVENGNVTDEQVSGAVSTWLTAHPEATTTVQDGSVSAKKLEGYHVVCRDVPWTLFLDGYKTTTTVSSEEPGCAIYCVKLESGKTYCISNLPYPDNTNEFVTDPSINYFGYYFGYSTLPDVDANVASNRDRLYGYFVAGLLNTFMISAINRGYIEFAISGDMPGGSAPYYFTVKQDCFLLRASTKPATGQRINNLPVAEVLPGMSDIGYGPSGQAWSTFKKDLGSSYAGDNGYVQQIFASKVATAEKQRAYAAMSRDVPRDRTLNIQFIGDSITYAASNAGLQNSFVKYVSMNLQAQQLRLCQSGVSVTTGGGSYDWNGKPNSSADYNAEMSGYSGLVQKLAEYKSNLSLSVWSDSVDIVVVELGTNDHWEQSALGVQTDLTADTNFYGAVEKTLTLLEETFPHAQILWLLPFKNQRWKTSTIKLVDYLIALKVICQMHTRCWVLDLTDKWFLDYDDTDLRSSFFIDGVHITGAAHKCVAESMIDKIREIVSVCGTRQIETVHTTNANDSVYGSSST